MEEVEEVEEDMATVKETTVLLIMLTFLVTLQISTVTPMVDVTTFLLTTRGRHKVTPTQQRRRIVSEVQTRFAIS